MSISQHPSICMKCPQSCLKMEINVCVMATASMEQTPEPFVCRSTVQKNPFSPHNEFVTVAAVGLDLLRFSFSSGLMSSLLVQARQPAHPTKCTLCPMLRKIHKSMSSANRKSNKGLRPSSRDNPSASIFARHAMRTRPSPAPNQINVG